jgi:hypothetical protein
MARRLGCLKLTPLEHISVTLDPVEHQRYEWVTAEDVRNRFEDEEIT